ncbi:MAG: glycine cleavage system protein GcvH [Deltaproteobacteria bacterium]|nr:glycine cleavage system protein GcvH [Deltaproteobacteria bacterium]MBW2139874.1 glycine cleavage system protein GcvH [Deltaproteobacteria bacterium]
MTFKFHKEHTWVKVDGDEAFIGITDYAQEELGEIVYVDLPETDDELIAGDEFGQIESTKTTSELIAPVSGDVIESNTDLEDEPTLINDFPENRGWITKITPSDLSELDELMSEEEYQEFLENLDE